VSRWPNHERSRRLNGERLRQARKQLAGETGAETATALGVTEAYVSMVENGKRVPAAEMLATWCAHLGIPVDYVFDDAVPA
jgi:transcriptional regulator with XRE-family HTH domain